MHKFKDSLKHQFITLSTISIIVPLLIIIWFLPSFYNKKNSQQMITLTKSNLASIASNLSVYIDDLNKYTLSPYFNSRTLSSMKIRLSTEFETLSPYERLLSDRDFNSIVERFALESREEILSTLLISLNGSVAASSKYDGYLIEDYPFEKQDWYQKTLRADGETIFTGNHNYDYFSAPNTKKVFSVSRLIKDPQSQKPLGVMIASADTYVFSKLTKEINLGVSSYITILGENREVIYSTRHLPDELILALRNDDFDLKVGGDTFIPISHPIKNSPWQLVALISKNDLNKESNWMHVIAILFAVFTLVVLLIVFIQFSKLIIEPFGQMKRVMDFVKKGDLTKRFVPKCQNEVSELGLELNDMLVKLDDLIEKEYKMALNVKVAEYNALCSQIQPHFLFNTLTGFIGLNRLGEKDKLEKAIFSLTAMLRYSLSKENMTTLEKEFKFIENYLSLQKLRFEDRFDSALCFENGISEFPVPKLLLQPYVENSIIHGIEPSDDFCHIHIEAKRVWREKKPFIKIQLEDTGVGFECNHCDGNIGLNNPKERLLFEYPDASLVIESKVNEGTKITILIPN